VSESLDEVIERIAGFRARVLTLASRAELGEPVTAGVAASRAELRLVTGKD
jgi:hypothetical protein